MIQARVIDIPLTIKNFKMKKSAHQIWKESKKQNLSKEEFKEKLKTEGVIVKKMTKEELFKKYNIDHTHGLWNDKIDNWMSVEIFRIMHDGRLPTEKDTSCKYVLDFIEKKDSDFKWWINEIMVREDWGSLYLTAKRMVYKYVDEYLKEFNAI